MDQNLFIAGKNLWIEDKWRRSASPKSSMVKVCSPGRLHFSVFDFFAMRPPLPGGGGIGISTSTVNTTLQICIEPGPQTVNYCSIPATFKHIRSLFCTLIGFDDEKLGIKLEEKIQYQHSGFGSNVTGNTALFFGLNYLFGNPFSPNEIYKILTHNYVENDENSNNKVYFGYDTGIGEAAVLFGGFVLTDVKGKFVGRINPTTYVVTATADKNKLSLNQEYKGYGSKQKSETETLRTAPIKITDFQKEYNDRLYALQTRLTGFFKKHDITAFQSNLWDINRYGSFEYMRRKFSHTVLDNFVNISRKNKAIYAGISSAGPSMFALANDIPTAKKIESELKKELSSYFYSFQIGAAGNKVHIVNQIP